MNGCGRRPNVFTVVVHSALRNIIVILRLVVISDRRLGRVERRCGAELRTRLRLTDWFGVWCVPPPPRIRRNSATFAERFRQGSGNGGDGR